MKDVRATANGSMAKVFKPLPYEQSQRELELPQNRNRK